MKDTEAAWIAGLVDGEGCLFINRQRANSRSDLRTDGYRIYLKVSMGDRKTVARLRKLAGVGVVYANAKSKWNDSFSWTVPPAELPALLEELLPYLVTKKKEAQLGLQFCRRPLWQPGGRGGAARKPKRLVERDARFYWRLRMMKPTWRFHEKKLSCNDRKEIRNLGLHR